MSAQRARPVDTRNGAMTAKLVTIRGLGTETQIPVRTLRTLDAKGVLPRYKLGHRTVFYDVDEVRAALGKFKRKGAAE